MIRTIFYKILVKMLVKLSKKSSTSFPKNEIWGKEVYYMFLVEENDRLYSSIKKYREIIRQYVEEDKKIPRSTEETWYLLH